MDAVLPGLGALTLFVADLDASTPFYRDVLGLPTVHQHEDSTVFDLGPQGNVKTSALRRLQNCAETRSPH